MSSALQSIASVIDTTVDWTVDQVYSQLQTAKGLIDGLVVDLDANKQDLEALWAASKSGNLPSNVYGPPDPAVVAAAQASLEPLIHQNSILRTQFVGPIKDKFNSVVGQASVAIQQAGYTAPPLYGLSGLGIAPLVFIAGSAVLLGIAFVIGWCYTTRQATDVQLQRTANEHAIIVDPRLTVPQKVQLLGANKAATEADTKNANANKPSGNPLDSLMPILGLVAAIVLVPPILNMLPKRQAVAA